MTWNLIASTSASGGSNITSSALNCVGADLIVVELNSFATGTFSDSNGNTYTQIGPFNTTNIRSSMFYSLGPSVSSAQTFKYTGSSTFTGFNVTAWSGSKGSGLVDQTNDAIGAAVTTLAPGSITPTAANSLVLIGLGTDTAISSLTNSLGTVQQNLVWFSGITGSAIASFVQGSPAAINPTWSWTTSSAHAVAIVASFPPAPPPPASTIALFDNVTRHWRVTIMSLANGTSSSVFSGKGYQIGAYALTGTLGVGGTAQWRGSNDGVNFVPIGAAITSIPATGLIASPDNGVYALYRLDATAGDVTTSFNATVDFSSQNMS